MKETTMLWIYTLPVVAVALWLVWRKFDRDSKETQ